jgi:hypothetical protein
MDAIKGFFAKYNAVPCNSKGEIDYRKSTDAALIAHAQADAKAWDTDLPGDVRLQVQERLVAIGCEMFRRMRKMPCWGGDAGNQPPEYVALLRGTILVTERAGWTVEIQDAICGGKS